MSAAPLISAAAYWGMPAVAAPLVPCEPPPPPVPALPPQPPLPPSQPPYEPPAVKALPVDKTKKGKKDKVRIWVHVSFQCRANDHFKKKKKKCTPFGLIFLTLFFYVIKPSLLSSFFFFFIKYNIQKIPQCNFVLVCLCSQKRVRSKCHRWWRSGRASRRSWMRKRKAAPVTRTEISLTRRVSRTGSNNNSWRMFKFRLTAKIDDDDDDDDDDIKT